MRTILSLAAAALLAACGSNAPEGVNGDAPVAPMANNPAVVASPTLPAAVTTAWSAATGHYLELKDALVASDLAAAQSAARAMTAALAGADMAAMADAHDLYMQQAAALQPAANEIATAATLEAAREAFGPLTGAVVAAVGQLGDGGRDLYVQYCPMAFDNEGAEWVAAEREVRNPYFGDAMLTCGRVTREL